MYEKYQRDGKHSLVARGREIVLGQVAAVSVAVPQVVVSIVVRDKGALDGMRSGGVTAERSCVSGRGADSIGFPGQVFGIRVGCTHRRQESLVERDLVDTGPVAAEGEIGLSVRSDHDTGVNGVGLGVWIHVRAIACSCLDNSAMVIPTTRSRVIGCRYTDGTVSATRLAYTVEAVEGTIHIDDIGSPGYGTVALGNDGVCVEHGADVLPWPGHGGSGMDEDVLADIVQVEGVADVHDRWIMGMLVGLTRRREMTEGGLLLQTSLEIAIEVHAKRDRKKT